MQPLGNEAVVRVKGQLLFTADWATARFNRTTPTLLAEWLGGPYAPGAAGLDRAEAVTLRGRNV